MIHVFGKRLEGMVLGDPLEAPGLGLGLEGADHQLAGIFLVIGAFVRHAHHRHVARQIGDRLADDVEMLARMKRDVDADREAQIARPHAAGDDDLVGHDRAVCRLDALGRAILDDDARDLGVLEDLRPARAGAGGQRLRDVDRVDLAVLGQEHAADHALEIVMRHALLDLGRRDDIDGEAEILGHRGAALQFLHAAVAERDRDRAVLLEAGGLAGFLLEALRTGRSCISPVRSGCARRAIARRGPPHARSCRR